MMLSDEIGPDPVCSDAIIILRIQLRSDPVPANAEHYGDDGAPREMKCDEIQSYEPGTFKTGLHGLAECFYGLPGYDLVQRLKSQTEGSIRKEYASSRC